MFYDVARTISIITCSNVITGRVAKCVGVITYTVTPLCYRESVYGTALHRFLQRLSEEVRHISSRPLFIVWRQSIVSYPGG